MRRALLEPTVYQTLTRGLGKCEYWFDGLLGNLS